PARASSCPVRAPGRDRVSHSRLVDVKAALVDRRDRPLFGGTAPAVRKKAHPCMVSALAAGSTARRRTSRPISFWITSPSEPGRTDARPGQTRLECFSAADNPRCWPRVPLPQPPLPPSRRPGGRGASSDAAAHQPEAKLGVGSHPLAETRETVRAEKQQR